MGGGRNDVNTDPGARDVSAPDVSAPRAVVFPSAADVESAEDENLVNGRGSDGFPSAVPRNNDSNIPGCAAICAAPAKPPPDALKPPVIDASATPPGG